MAYRIVGVGLEPLIYSDDDLGHAAYLASKLTDNGGTDVRVLDVSGKEVSRAELEAAMQVWFDQNGWRRPTA